MDGGSREERADGAANMKFADPHYICTKECGARSGLSSCWLSNHEAERVVHGEIPVLRDLLNCFVLEEGEIGKDATNKCFTDRRPCCASHGKRFIAVHHSWQMQRESRLFSCMRVVLFVSQCRPLNEIRFGKGAP